MFYLKFPLGKQMSCFTQRANSFNYIYICITAQASWERNRCEGSLLYINLTLFSPPRKWIKKAKQGNHIKGVGGFARHSCMYTLLLGNCHGPMTDEIRGRSSWPIISHTDFSQTKHPDRGISQRLISHIEHREISPLHHVHRELHQPRSRGHCDMSGEMRTLRLDVTSCGAPPPCVPGVEESFCLQEMGIPPGKSDLVYRGKGAKWHCPELVSIYGAKIPRATEEVHLLNQPLFRPWFSCYIVFCWAVGFRVDSRALSKGVLRSHVLNFHWYGSQNKSFSQNLVINRYFPKRKI